MPTQTEQAAGRLLNVISEASLDYTERLAKILQTQLEYAYHNPKQKDFCSFFNGWQKTYHMDLTESELLFAEDGAIYYLGRPALFIDLDYKLQLLGEARTYLKENGLQMEFQ